MKILEAVVQGVVQGLTEFLPVSSSGHLVLSQHILGVSQENLFFDVMLHLGTLAAVIAVYHKTIIRLIKAFFEIVASIFRGNFKRKKLNGDKNMVIMVIVGLLPLFLIFLPIPEGNANLKDLAEYLAQGDRIVFTGISLLVTSLLLHIGAKKNKENSQCVINKKTGKISNKDGRKYLNVYDALWVGFAQFLAAIFPGLSRSGSTLSVGMIRGVSKNVALDYSFILGIPAVLAAALLEIKEVVKTKAYLEIDMAPVIVGAAVSAAVGFAAIKIFKRLVNSGKINAFVIYALVVGGLTVVIGLIETFKGVNIFTGVPL